MYIDRDSVSFNGRNDVIALFYLIPHDRSAFQSILIKPGTIDIYV